MYCGREKISCKLSRENYFNIHLCHDRERFTVVRGMMMSPLLAVGLPVFPQNYWDNLRIVKQIVKFFVEF